MSYPQLCAWARTRLDEMRADADKKLVLLRADIADAGSCRASDVNDVASNLADAHISALTLDSVSCLVLAIRRAQTRLDSGEYGYCVDTGEEIPVDRLLVNPLADRTVYAQERQDKRNLLLRR